MSDGRRVPGADRGLLPLVAAVRGGSPGRARRRASRRVRLALVEGHEVGRAARRRRRRLDGRIGPGIEIRLEAKHDHLLAHAGRVRRPRRC